VPLRFVRVSAADVGRAVRVGGHVGGAGPVRGNHRRVALARRVPGGGPEFLDTVAALVPRVLNLGWTRDAGLLRPP